MTQPGQNPASTPPTAGNPNALVVGANEQGGVEAAAGVIVSGLARSDLGLERIQTVVTIPTDFQYSIPIKGLKNPDGSWDNSKSKVGLTADAYDFLNRVVGASFFLPEYIHDASGDRFPNPIHRKDYIYLRLGCVWYTPLGQLSMATEDVEVDFNLTWMDARINSRSAKVVMGDNALPRFDDFGNPMVELTPEDELKALKTLSQLRTFGPRYAQTVARVRLLKLATGLRSLPIDVPHDYRLPMVGYRDQMTPQARIEKAGGTLAALYGKPADIKPLTQEEMLEVSGEVDPDTEAIDRELVGTEADREPIAADEAQLDAALDRA